MKLLLSSGFEPLAVQLPTSLPYRLNLDASKHDLRILIPPYQKGSCDLTCRMEPSIKWFLVETPAMPKTPPIPLFQLKGRTLVKSRALYVWRYRHPLQT